MHIAGHGSQYIGFPAPLQLPGTELPGTAPVGTATAQTGLCFNDRRHFTSQTTYPENE